MAYESTLRNIALPASADLSASQFLFAVVNNAGQLAVAGAGAAADGILQDKANAAGQIATLAIFGISKAVVGAAGVTVGDLVMSDAAGKAATASAGNYVLGRALATGTSGQIIPVLIQPKAKI